MLDKFNRRSIRLHGYDYSQEGLYFVTLCVQNRLRLFGEIVDSEMLLNQAGEYAQTCWLEIPKHFSNVNLHEFVIMPNHIHGIIEIVGAKNFLPSNVNTSRDYPQNKAKDISPLHGTSKTIGSIVRGFKIGVTKWCRHHTDIYNVWQRNYYEHIIRDFNDYGRIVDYIQDNPSNWPQDDLLF